MITEPGQRFPGRRPVRAGVRARVVLPVAVRLAAVLSCVALAGCEATLDAAPSSDGGSDTTSGQPVKGPAGSALAALEKITVKGKGPTTGFSRDEFGSAWRDTDHNGCDQRNDVLRRDLTGEKIKARTAGCIVLSGTLVDHYTGKTITFRKADASAVQIDHVVALQNAWVTGAFKWTEDKRTALANDPLNLLAVDGPTNSSKGAGDAATWLPPRKAFRCTYIARQVAVKVKYGAWMTTAEHKAAKKILTTCPKQKLPQVQTIPLGEGAPAKSTGSTKTTGSSGSTDTVSAGAFCSPIGAKGVSAAGTKMVCSSKDGAPARWRSAKG